MRALVTCISLATALGFPVWCAPDVQAILQRSVEANERDWQAVPRYAHRERDRLAHGSRTYEVTMIQGSPYRWLVAIDDEPLSPVAREAEQRKLTRTIAQRQAESPDQRASRIARFQKDRRRDHLLMEQLTQAFDFTLLGVESVDGHQAYKFQATGKRGYRPPSLSAEVLTGMEGTLWIDQQTCQWVKVEAHVVRPVSIEGFLARVTPGTRFELEYTPVTRAVWLPSHFAMHSRSRVLLVLPHATQADETYSDYHSVSTRTGRTAS